MMTIQLSKRLEAVASLVRSGSAVADIGSDHALLPVYLIQSGVASKAVAGEVNAGPLQAARKQVEESGLTEKISVRMGNGLEAVAAGEVDTITIAGMGGGTIVDILSRGAAEGKLQGVSRLVLQPNIGERLVREWLIKNGWELKEERILEEDGIIYEVLAADASTPSAAALYNESLYSAELPQIGQASKEIRLLLGPILLKDPNPAFMEKWSVYTDKLERMIEQIGKSELPEALRKKELLQQECAGIRGVLRCLSASKTL
jgi:tRNA (adenine22-N1)-methyltransferase